MEIVHFLETMERQGVSYFVDFWIETSAYAVTIKGRLKLSDFL